LPELKGILSRRRLLCG